MLVLRELLAQCLLLPLPWSIERSSAVLLVLLS
jgi:hypothetical protein